MYRREEESHRTDTEAPSGASRVRARVGVGVRGGNAWQVTRVSILRTLDGGAGDAAVAPAAGGAAETPLPQADRSAPLTQLPQRRAPRGSDQTRWGARNPSGFAAPLGSLHPHPSSAAGGKGKYEAVPGFKGHPGLSWTVGGKAEEMKQRGAIPVTAWSSPSPAGVASSGLKAGRAQGLQHIAE